MQESSVPGWLVGLKGSGVTGWLVPPSASEARAGARGALSGGRPPAHAQPRARPGDKTSQRRDRDPDVWGPHVQKADEGWEQSSLGDASAPLDKANTALTLSAKNGSRQTRGPAAHRPLSPREQPTAGVAPRPRPRSGSPTSSGPSAASLQGAGGLTEHIAAAKAATAAKARHGHGGQPNGSSAPGRVPAAGRSLLPRGEPSTATVAHAVAPAVETIDGCYIAEPCGRQQICAAAGVAAGSKYACPRCGLRFNKWGECMVHVSENTTKRGGPAVGPAVGPRGAEPPVANNAAGLPIDSHRERILAHIASHRVTIIIGETGCGKSSRVPSMIYESDPRRARLFVSQPRRIAATTVMQRVKGALGSVVGLRLGHGVREESKDTRLWFCTAGYLKEYLAHNEDKAGKITHIIIDEVHERSIDTDLLCFFVRRLLTVSWRCRIGFERALTVMALPYVPPPPHTHTHL